MNAIDALTANGHALAAQQCSADPAVRCVVLTAAANRAFSASGDVAGFALGPEQVDSLIDKMAAYLHEAVSCFACAQMSVMHSRPS
jgi:enoyl-CoA hydratase/carnithine racemase